MGLLVAACGGGESQDLFGGSASGGSSGVGGGAPSDAGSGGLETSPSMPAGGSSSGGVTVSGAGGTPASTGGAQNMGGEAAGGAPPTGGAPSGGAGGADATHCANALQDADESGIDCGGVDCAACATDAGAWAICTADDQCGGGRVCTYGLVQLAAPGRAGYCTSVCDPAAGNSCEAVPVGAEGASCLSLGGPSVCALTCIASSVCPDGLECVFLPTLFGVSLCLPTVGP